MFQAGDKVIVARLETSVRQSTIHEKAKDSQLGDWITEKGKTVKRKATIGQLGRVPIPVLFPDGSIHQKPYPDLTFGKGNKVSWEAKRADSIKVIDNEETVIKGKNYIARGVIAPSFRTQHIPVILNGDTVMIPLNQIVFKEKK